MSDRVKIRAEVQRLRRELGEQRDVNLDELIAYIDSMPEETASEDLEEEIEFFWNSHDGSMNKFEYQRIVDCAHHFAEWQREKDIRLEKLDDLEKFAQKWAYSNYHKELDEVNCDCLYSGVIKGAEWQKQQMMKDAVYGYVSLCHDYPYRRSLVAIEDGLTNLEYAEKVKIVIVKESML